MRSKGKLKLDPELAAAGTKMLMFEFLFCSNCKSMIKMFAVIIQHDHVVDVRRKALDIGKM